jgi:nitrous oxidase accessory protein
MFSVIVERNPPVLMMFHSFMTTMMDKAERMLPGITPVDLIDNKPLMKPFKSSTK